jgi:hypothetical protein
MAPDVAAALLREAPVASCARESGRSSLDYLRHAFEVRIVHLRSGERMVVAVSNDGCLALGQSSRVLIFQRVPGSGRLREVLNGTSLPSAVTVNEDGSVILPTHETMETIFEAAYVWNGTRYADSAQRSTIYDVALGARRPYETPVRFAPGRFSTTLGGTVATNFGDRYVFQARKGQRLTLRLLSLTGSAPWVVVAHGATLLVLQNAGDRFWTGMLPETGAYSVDLSGRAGADATTLSRYRISLEIR